MKKRRRSSKAQRRCSRSVRTSLRKISSATAGEEGLGPSTPEGKLQKNGAGAGFQRVSGAIV